MPKGKCYPHFPFKGILIRFVKIVFEWVLSTPFKMGASRLNKGKLSEDFLLPSDKNWGCTSILCTPCSANSAPMTLIETLK